MLLQEEQAEEQGDYANWHVHEEDPAPRQLVHQQTSNHWTEGGGKHSWDDEDARDLDALRRGKRSIQHSSSNRRKRTPADALQDPEADQQGEARSQAAQGRRYAEEGQRQQENAPGTPAVTQPSRSGDDGGQADQISNYDRVESGTGGM